MGNMGTMGTMGRRVKYLLQVLFIVALIYMMDTHIPKPLPVANGSYSAKTVIITGANAGVGYETSRQLAVNYGMQVIMGCRSETKCNNAANTINAEIASSKSNGSVTPLLIDLANLDSVKSFASQLEDRKVDILFNNAGYSPESNIPVNSYGLDPSFTSMHLAHFFLTEQIAAKNPKLRAVTTSSETHHMCAIPFAYVPSFILHNLPSKIRSELLPQRPGCIDEEYLHTGIGSATDGAAYFQAKIANVMHSLEIPKHHPGVTSIAIDLGWVGTNIIPVKGIGSLTPTNLGWMRSASVGVKPVLHAILTNNDELTNSLEKGRQLSSSGIMMNVFGQAEEAFTYNWWKDGANGNLSTDRMTALSEKLWQKSEELLKINGY